MRKAFHSSNAFGGGYWITEFTRRRALEIFTVDGLAVTIVLPFRWVKLVVESVICTGTRPGVAC
jgi:hypothetical protein